jgi:hypothetical protein
MTEAEMKVTRNTDQGRNAIESLGVMDMDYGI